MSAEVVRFFSIEFLIACKNSQHFYRSGFYCFTFFCSKRFC